MLDLTLFEIMKISRITSYLDEEYHNKKIINFSIYTDGLAVDHLYFHWKTGSENLHLIDKALKKGAFVITSDPKYKNIESKRSKIIHVPSVKKILLALASYKRSIFTGDVIVVTGSVGKSSVKNMLSKMLSMNSHVIHTIGNENAWLGIYCTLCNIKKTTQYVVLETGASGVGSLSVPIKVVSPTISILLDINFSHQEKYPTLTDLLLEKSSVIDALKPGGRLVVSTRTFNMLKKIDYRIRNDINIVKVGEDDADIKILKFSLEKKESSVDIYFYNNLITLKIPQGNNADLINAVYVYAVLNGFDFNFSKFNALSNFYAPLPRRFDRNRVGYKHNLTFELIDDAYNSSPISVQSLLESISIRKVKNKVLILGDMLELGADSQKIHQSILDNPLLNQFNKIILIGDILFKCVKSKKMESFLNVDDFIPYIDSNFSDGSLIVLKASNAINLYKLHSHIKREAISFEKNINWFVEDEKN
ncbi:Mur ligase family protein [Acinetobacter sp. ANC 3882]|uniref:Mur ligase family protein n=1 Tax=Acinetobacter sp. ANC 3882 TaxID=2923423 RepID=UPI001F4AAB29|nr:Mur ligase family protein [Acinetobacter sp. ANC 3882]MCH7315987.1 Mur ligase family protein [Acinetobacter sp. ANC 3882]